MEILGNMPQGQLKFNVTDLDVMVAEGVEIVWEGREMNSGPLVIALGKPGSHGIIDYTSGEVNVEFRVQITFPELSEILSDLGADPSITRPIDGIIHSRGSVFDDHSLRLAGKGELVDHRLFDSSEMRIEIRAPSQ